jgi:hypothetical protein
MSGNQRKDWLTGSSWPVYAVLMLALVAGTVSVRHGMFFFPDEIRYLMPLDVYNWFQTHNPQAMALLRSGVDRPLYYVLYSPILWLGNLVNTFPYPIDPVSGWTLPLPSDPVPKICQVLLHVLNTFLVLRIVRRLFNRSASLLAGVLHALWLPNLLYTRHILPPLLAETFLLCTMQSALNTSEALPDEKAERRSLLKTGSWWLAVFLVYPGFYYTGLGLILLAFLTQTQSWRHRWLRLFYLLLPTLVFILLASVICGLLFQLNYPLALKGLADSVIQGDTGNALGFLFDYYRQISHVILILGLLAWALGWKDWFAGRRNAFSWLSVVTTVGYAWLILFVGLSGTVLYGRTLLPLALPTLWQSADFLTSRIKPRAVSWSLIGLCLLGLVWSLPGFWAVRFPLDAVAAFEQRSGLQFPNRFLHSGRIPDFSIRDDQVAPNVYVIQTRTVSTKPSPEMAFGCHVLSPALQRPGTIYLFINTEVIAGFDHVNPISDPHLLDGQVLMNRPYPARFFLYGYEGMSTRERALMSGVQEIPMMVVRDPCGRKG